VLLAVGLTALIEQVNTRWQLPMLPKGDLIVLLPRRRFFLPKQTWNELPRVHWRRFSHGFHWSE
jgi:hypothetical protein